MHEIKIQNLQELVDANNKHFEEFRINECERIEVINQCETQHLEKGEEHKIGVITEESSDNVKDVLNKNFQKFNRTK